MLYQVLSRMIIRGDTEGLRDKIDVFYAMGRLTEAQYTELCGMLTQEA